MNDFLSVAEDIEWLRKAWLSAQSETISESDLRRGSSTLRLLLIEGLVQKAWRHFGHEKQPMLIGPDIAALAARDGLRLDLAAAVIAGGGRVGGVELSFLGIFRADNQETGVPADAEEGFGVTTTYVTRDAGSPLAPSPLDALVRHQWRLSDYLESPGAVRKGVLIKRREVIEYFRNYAGGSHHKLLSQKKHASKRDLYELAAELGRHTQTHLWDGLHFELLSIGQAVAESPDLIELADQIRESSNGK